MKKTVLSVLLIFTLLFGLAGCFHQKDNGVISDDDTKLIYEETIYPNEEYVERKEDIVYYTVKIYQDKDFSISVDSQSNSGFFKPVQYEVECDTGIEKKDIDVEWTTAMGNTAATEDDQLCIAWISISGNGELFDKRKISFISGEMEIIEDSINKNK